MNLSGRVCIVTGATRGIGKGIALQLGANGATVYITGRTLKAKEGCTGSLEETVQEIEERGGTCIPVQCDHTKDSDIEQLFKRVATEQNGRLDLLVNNAYSAVNYLVDKPGKKFYELSTDSWDIVNNVGLRNHYLCAVYAARLMVAQNHGTIIWISSGGGLRYLFNVAYGVGKAACDRMAADCGFELRKKNVCCISLWPGAVRTENIMTAKANRPDDLSKGLTSQNIDKMFENGESIEFAGKAIVALMQEKDIMKRTGKIVLTADVGCRHGISDIDGRTPVHLRSVAGLLEMQGYTWLAWITPGWLRVPFWAMHMASNKF